MYVAEINGSEKKTCEQTFMFVTVINPPKEMKRKK